LAPDRESNTVGARDYPYGKSELAALLNQQWKGLPLGERTGWILLVSGTGSLAILALIQLIRGDYLSLGICLLGVFFGVLAFALNRRANKKS